MIVKLIIFARKIHRITMWATLIFVIVMGSTGLTMKLGIEEFRVRAIHNNISIFFSLSLATMALSGIIMYFAPTLVRMSKKG